MKKKITIVDKDLNQLVVVADCSSALYQDRGTKLGEQNLLSDTAVTFKVYDGTAQVAVMMADILQVPTKQGTMADIWPTPANPLPDKQLAINYLCARNAERQMLCDKDPKDSVAMVLPITTHLYIDSIKVENAYKRRGIATGINDAANEEVTALLSSAAPANDGASLLLDNVPADFDGRTLSLTNERVLVKDGDSEVVFAPASYNADDIQFTDTKQTLSGFTVARSDYADSDSSKTYLVEGTDHNFLAVTNNEDLLNSILQVQ